MNEIQNVSQPIKAMGKVLKSGRTLSWNRQINHEILQVKSSKNYISTLKNTKLRKIKRKKTLLAEEVGQASSADA